MFIAVNGGEVVAEAQSLNALKEAVVAHVDARLGDGGHFDVYQKVGAEFKIERKLVCVEVG